MGYRIETINGSYCADDVSEEGSFLVLDGGSSSEIRIPTFSVEKIEKQKEESSCVGAAIVAGLGLLCLAKFSS